MYVRNFCNHVSLQYWKICTVINLLVCFLVVVGIYWSSLFHLDCIILYTIQLWKSLIFLVLEFWWPCCRQSQSSWANMTVMFTAQDLHSLWYSLQWPARNRSRRFTWTDGLAPHPSEGHSRQTHPYLHGPDCSVVKPPKWERHTHEANKNSFSCRRQGCGCWDCWGVYLSSIQKIQLH